MSTFITGVRITSFMPFRGEHELELGRGTYAVVARHEGDERRSNWAGKSSFLGAVWFALTGDHPKRTEDEWITDGEQEGGVDLEFSTGVFVSRTRKRGATTKLRVVVPELEGGERELLGDAAQDYVDKHILGMGREESEATWWCAQEEVAWFLKEDPAAVTRRIADWCGLERLRAARDAVAKEGNRMAAELSGRLAASRASAETARTLEDYIFALHEVANVTELGAVAHQLEADVAAMEARASMNAEALARRDDRVRLEQHEDVRRVLMEEYRKMPLPMGPNSEELDAALREETAARLDHADKQREYSSKERLACGEFDGTCPVGGILCPVTDKLNADRAGNAKLLAAAGAAKERAEVAFELASQRHRGMKKAAAVARAEQQARDNVERRIDELDAKIAALKAKDIGIGEAADEFLPQRLVESRGKLEDIRKRLAVVASHNEMADSSSRKAAELEPEVAARREAAQVLTAAERAVAEQMLELVADGSNELLADSGVDLSVDFSWERPIKGLSDSCDACGASFPSSKTATLCAACGAARGQKTERKFRAAVRPLSGGAQSLAGLAVRLSAFGWLKGARGSNWGVVCADEPLAAVDQANSQGVARQLPRLLGSRYGAAQAFVTAHNRGVLDAMPRRILITATERGSRVEVVGG